MKVAEAFPAFTALYHYCRPKEADLIVYEVDAGEPTDYNLVMKAAKFVNEQIEGETSLFIISKEWVLENIDRILESVNDVSDSETTGA